MAWTTPGTATAGDVLTAAFWNTQVRDNMQTLAPAYARINGGTSQTGIVTSTFTKVNSTSPTVTNPLGWTISAGEITIPGSTLPGVYHIYGFVQWDGATAGVRLLQIAPASSLSSIVLANSTQSPTHEAFPRSAISGLTIITTDVTYCLVCYQTSGTNRDLSQNNADFVVSRVAPLA